MIGEELRAARTHEGLSQEALARELDVATITIRSWESGRTAINPDMASRIRGVLAGYYDARPEHYALHVLPDGTGVVVWRNSAYRIIGGQSGFSSEDVNEARATWDAGEDVELRDWEHLAITEDAAAYVAVSYPAIGSA